MIIKYYPSLYEYMHEESSFLLLFAALPKKPRDSFALEREVSDLFAHEGVKVIAVHDLTVLLVGQASAIGEVDWLVLLTSKSHIDNLGQHGLGAKIIGSALPWGAVRGDFQG